MKQLNKDEIQKIAKEKNEIIFFLDFGSSSLTEIKNLDSEIFILDHHQINESELPLPKNISFINPNLFEEEVSASALAYLFSKELNQSNLDLASLAILGMIGDFRNLGNSRISNSILKDAKDVTVKKSLLLFSSTRPIHKALEFSSSIYIPGVTGNAAGAITFLREAGIKLKDGKRYRTLLDLTKEETSRLLTLISLKRNDAETIGTIYLIKFFNHLEDARELSVLLNACGRLGYGDTALSFCLGSRKAKTTAESVYSKYKHHLISGLKWISVNKKIEGENYVIINAGSAIKDTIMGTLLSILSSSFVYPQGTVLAGLALSEENRIKVSARVVGEPEEINLKKILETAAKAAEGEAGGHKKAAGCTIPTSQEAKFLSLLEQELAMQKVKIKVS